MSETEPHAAQATDAAALASFIDKWRSRWPEWTLAEVFVPSAQREVVLAWSSLQQELLDASWGGSDPRPGEAKLSWWQDELRGWSQSRRRHPLGSVLQNLPAPWAGLGDALPALAASRERPRDEAEAFAGLLPPASAAAAIEQVLFVPVDEAAATGASRLIVAHWLLLRTAGDDAGAAPLGVLARAGAGDASSLWRAELLRDWPGTHAASRPRRLWAEITRARGARGDMAMPLSPWATLWTAWRGARNESLRRA